MKPTKVSRTFYERDEVVLIAKELLGKVLCTQFDGIKTSGIIAETEAYNGRTDKACHSHIHGRTERTKIMFGKPGFAYVYLCYGIHHLFNVVTNKEGFADAVLIRAIEPLEGIDEILQRRKKPKLERSVGGGPGIASQALGITTKNYGVDLLGDEIWIEDHGKAISNSQIIASPRVGVDYAGEDAKLPWRFRIKRNRFTSPAK
ncbi:MAG: DNA-3-methyladenine glycosylase [Balneolaceae bacterium]|nr:DNA-3-methyladenine glycosylase [Balneolaceae bacterium]MBO6544968.1 DNA-3-methyladenine glycosylase [Balneolaceae bacterium]MBO6646364.1 DNA-3-methyladenine glycosylase [Balneolaceae bacterium]